MPAFSELGLSDPLLEALTHLGYEQPTAIQEQAIPALLGGRDVIGQAQTGTGKTAAFGLPLLEYIDTGDPDVQALVLTPTRELCIQVTQALRAYGRAKGVDVVAVFGGAPIRNQVAQLKAGAHVVVGTVGRVMDLMNRHELVLTSSRFVVLDEADEMLDLGFLEDVETILGRCPSGRQTALFSATMPLEIRRLAEKGMYDPETIKVRAATLTIDTVAHYRVDVASDREKADALARVLKAERPQQAIIFVRTKIGTDRLARSLNDKGVRVKALHGDMSQGSRDGVMIAFKEGRERLLVATDIAARGLDISGVTHVVNYDMPNSPELYVHRIGRTGRVGRSGKAITLVTARQERDREAIERHSGIRILEWSADGAAAERAAPEGVAAGDSEAPGREAGAPVPAPPEAVPAPPEAVPAPPEAVPAPPQELPAEAEESAPRRRARRRRRAAEPATTGAPAEESARAVSEPPGKMADGEPPRGVPEREPPEGVPEDEPPPLERQPRRPRHTKPRRAYDGATAKLLVGAGRAQGLEPADVVSAIVGHSHLEGEDIRNVRVLERFSIVEVPAERAAEVVAKVHDNDVRGVTLRLEVAKS